MGVKVIACAKAEIPVFSGAYVTRKTEVLRQFAVILHLLLVEGTVAVAHAVVNGEVPRHLPLHISVRIQSDVTLFLLV